MAPGLVLLIGLSLAYLVLVSKPSPESRAPVPGRAPVVTVTRVQLQDAALSVNTQGTVQPRRQINVVSQVAGRVEGTSPQFAEGGFFDEDSELVKVEASDYEFALIRAKARVAEAEQLVATEKGRVRQASREWRDLGNDEANQLFLRKPQLASAEAALRAARADLGQAQLNLQRTSISVPFNGRISEKYVDVGQYIALGTPVARVYATDVVEVRLPLTDRQVALLDLPLTFEDNSVIGGTGALVTLSARFAEQQWQWQGQIVRTDASIDLDSRVVYAVVEVEHPFTRVEGSNRPPLGIGLYVDAEIAGRQISQLAILPRQAVRNDSTVLLVDENNRIQPRPVTLVKSNQQQAWLLGLHEQERVVVTHIPLAVAGMEVTPRSAESIAGDILQ